MVIWVEGESECIAAMAMSNRRGKIESLTVGGGRGGVG